MKKHYLEKSYSQSLFGMAYIAEATKILFDMSARYYIFHDEESDSLRLRICLVDEPLVEYMITNHEYYEIEKIVFKKGLNERIGKCD